MLRAGVVALALSMAVASQASAAVVHVVPASAPSLGVRGPGLIVTALSGERNDVTVRIVEIVGNPYDPDYVRYSVADTGGSPLLPGPGCHPDPLQTRTICIAPDVAQRVHVELGDGDDSAGIYVPHASLSGGDGDDTLTTGVNPYATIDPGRGDDTVTALGPSAGIYYTARTEPVTVDLQAGTGGAAGEHDVFTNIWHVAGGSGGDTLLGNDRSNDIDAGPGDDFIDGRISNDVIHCGPGFDTVVYDPQDTLRNCEA